MNCTHFDTLVRISFAAIPVTLELIGKLKYDVS